MAQAEPKIARRSLFAALLAAPIIAHPMKAKALPALKPGNIWVQVPQEAWTQFLEAVHGLAESDRERAAGR
jgi:hypothetical protein